MNTQTVELTAEHIEHGVRNNCRDCPVGLTLRHAMEEDGLSVDTNEACFYSKDGEIVAYSIDSTIAEAIRYYDQTGEMSPMTLIIDHDAKTITVQL